MSVHECEREREREGRTGKKSSTIHRRRQHGAPGARWWKIPHVTDWLIDNQWQREGEPGWRGGETGTAGSNMREKTTKGEKAPSRKYENEAADGRFEGRIQVWLHTYQLLMCFHQCHNSRGGGACLSQIYSRRPEEENKAVFHKHWIFQQDTKKLSLSSRKIMLICS